MTNQIDANNSPIAGRCKNKIPRDFEIIIFTVVKSFLYEMHSKILFSRDEQEEKAAPISLLQLVRGEIS